MSDDSTTATTDEELRWPRAASWARGESLGPRTHGIPDDEAQRIEALRDRILEVGEDVAADEIGPEAL